MKLMSRRRAGNVQIRADTLCPQLADTVEEVGFEELTGSTPSSLDGRP